MKKTSSHSVQETLWRSRLLLVLPSSHWKPVQRMSSSTPWHLGAVYNSYIHAVKGRQATPNGLEMSRRRMGRRIPHCAAPWRAEHVSIFGT